MQGTSQAIHSEPQQLQGAPQLSRLLGAKDAAAIMISNMIGVGILTLPGLVALSIGNPLLALGAWALGGAVSLAGALVHAELGCRYPLAGGDYVFLREAFGKLPAFLSGWTSFVVGFPGAIAASAMAAAQCLLDTGLLEAESLRGSRWWQLTLAGSLLLAISLVHATGLRLGKRFQNLLTCLKLSILVVLVAGGAIFVAPKSSLGSDLTGGFRLPLPVAGLLILFAYSGWNSAAYVAGEIREPRKNLPRALVAGVLVVTLLYLAVNLIYFRVVPPERMGEINVGGEVAEQIFGPRGKQVTSAALFFVFAASASAMILTGPRIYYAMACDGVFPRALTAVGGKSHAPVVSLWLQTLWALAILVAGTALTTADQRVSETFETIVSWTTFAILPFVALTTGAVFVVRRRDRAQGGTRSFSTPAYPWIPMAFVVAVLVITVSAFVATTPEYRSSAVVGFCLVAAGLPVYLFWKRWGKV